MSVADPRDSSCLLVFGLASKPELLLAPFLLKTNLLVDPGLSLGHLPRGLTRLELGQLPIMGSLGLEPMSHIKGLELEFCRYFCPESLSSGPVVET